MGCVIIFVVLVSALSTPSDEPITDDEVRVTIYRLRTMIGIVTEMRSLFLLCFSFFFSFIDVTWGAAETVS